MVPPIFINVPPVSDIFESIAHFLNEEGYRKCINRFKEKTCMAICGLTINISQNLSRLKQTTKVQQNLLITNFKGL